MSFETSQTTEKLDLAMAKARGEMKPAAMDKKNPHYNSRFASHMSVWESAQGPLAKHEISVTQWPIHSMDDRLWLVTRVAHKGEWYKATFSAPVQRKDVQGYGSAITYLKRYAFCAAIGIVADEDDDGNAAADRKAPPTKANPAPAKNNQKRNYAPASADMLDNLANLQSARSVTDEELVYLIQKGYGHSNNQSIPTWIIKEILHLLSDESANSATVVAAAERLKNQKEADKLSGQSNPPPKGPPEYFVPFGSEHVKGKKLIEIPESKLREMLTWARTELKKVPPPAGAAAILEFQVKTTQFLKGMGVNVE